jgi:hypothetical protein
MTTMMPPVTPIVTAKARAAKAIMRIVSNILLPLQEIGSRKDDILLSFLCYIPVEEKIRHPWGRSPLSTVVWF